MEQTTHQIQVFDGETFIGDITIDPETDGLITVYKADREDTLEALYALHVAGMEYAVVIPEEVYIQINKTIDAMEEE